jgi:hypothetical protein
MTLTPRAVIVHRPTELDELLARHGTWEQAAFFLRSRGGGLDDIERRHAAQRDAMTTVASAIPADWRRGQVKREDLDRFLFAPEDLIIAVGQDGLVANVAKYLDGQLVLGVNPDPSRYPGVLVPHPPEATARLLNRAAAGQVGFQRRTMVKARLDDGQTLLALNEVFIGHPSHQSARYRIHLAGDRTERQSSSGLIAGTGTGATGWLRSAWQERHSALTLPPPDTPILCWFVREAWPSMTTGTNLTEGTIGPDDELAVTAEADHLVVFGDGIESDVLSLSYGQRLTVRVARQTLNLVDQPRSGPRADRRRPASRPRAMPDRAHRSATRRR